MMSEINYVCGTCGNKKEFRLITTHNLHEEVITLIDNTKEEIEVISEENYYDDFPNEVVECVECESEVIENFSSLKELYDFLYEHTREDGSWSEDELDEKDRNKSVYEELFLKNIKQEEDDL